MNQLVAMPWLSLWAFLRLSTNARVFVRPLGPEEAWSRVRDWLAAPAAWVPGATDRHADVLEDLIVSYDLTGDLIPDAQLVAIAIEHGLTVCSADTDFARFAEIRWENPLRDVR